MKRSGWVIAVVAVVAACGGGATPPGSIAMGSYRFEVDRADRAGAVTATGELKCNPGQNDQGQPTDSLEVFPEASIADFVFLATLSKNEGTEAFLTLKDRNRDAFFDGQVLTSTLDRATRFSNCRCDEGSSMHVVETLRMVVLSRSQRDALGDQCPADPFAPGAIPAPGSAPGIVGPSETAGGFDAVKTCGVLVDEIVTGDGCTCGLSDDTRTAGGCRITYPLIGERQ